MRQPTSPIEQQQHASKTAKEDERDRFSLDFPSDLRHHVHEHSLLIDRSMNYVICGILNSYFKVNKPGYKETKKYRID